MSRPPITNGALAALATLAVLVVARPAAGQSLHELRKNIGEEIKRVENRFERIMHDAGDRSRGERASTWTSPTKSSE